MGRFLQGDGCPVLYRYNGSGVLQDSVIMPYVRDDSSNSYIRQYLDPYPEDSIRQYQLLSGTSGEDDPIGLKFRAEIKYNSINAAKLQPIYNCILASRNNSGHYLVLQPRNDNASTYKIIFKGSLSLESNNMWQHNVVLEFTGLDLLANTFTFSSLTI